MNTHEIMEEKIDVQAIFKSGKVDIRALKWAGRVHKVLKVNLVHRNKIGENLFYFFSVSNQNQFYKLRLNTANLNWHIVEYYEE
jgi:hypothetical protein